MIFNFLWINTWIMPIVISTTILISIVLLLIVCVCFKGKDKPFCTFKMLNKSQETETFFSDNLKENTEQGFFRKLSWIGPRNLKTSNSTLKPYKNSNCINFKERSLSENELLDSMDNSNSFEHAVLQINNSDADNRQLDMAYDSDETLSCISDDSKFTAYSTFTLTRGVSFAETMKSASSHPDLDKL